MRAAPVPASDHSTIVAAAPRSAPSDDTFGEYDTNAVGRPASAAATPPWYRIETTARVVASSPARSFHRGVENVAGDAMRSATLR